MSLTKDDLSTIAALVSTAIKRDVPPIVEEIVERKLTRESDRVMQATAAGFEAVDKRFEAVDARFDRMDIRFDHMDVRLQSVEDQLTRVESKQNAEVDRADRQSIAIARLNHKFGLV